MNLELEKRMSESLEIAQGIQVVNSENIAQVTEIFKIGKEFEKVIKEHFAPLKKKAHESWKTLCDAETKALERIQPMLMLNKKIANYKYEQDRIRREQEEVRRKAEEERKRLEEEALRKAQEAEQSGNDEEAEKILEDAVNQENSLEPLPEVQATVETSGLSMREHWVFEIIDENLIPRNFMIPDRVKIGKFVRVMKGKTEIPGVRAYNDPTLAARIN